MSRSMGLAMIALACSLAVAAPPPATAPVQARVFYAMAIFPAEQARILALESDIDNKLRADLLRLLDDYARQVDAATDQVAIDRPNLHALVDQAQGALAADLQYKVLEPWLEAHPNADDAFERVRAEFQAIIDALNEDREKLVLAATSAGLPEGNKKPAKTVVDEAYRGFEEYCQQIERRRKEAGLLPENHPRHLEAMTIITDFELEKLRTAATIRQKLRELVPIDRRELLDDSLRKFGVGK